MYHYYSEIDASVLAGIQEYENQQLSKFRREFDRLWLSISHYTVRIILPMYIAGSIRQKHGAAGSSTDIPQHCRSILRIPAAI